MTDPRYKKLARLLVNYSTQIKKGDRALLDMIDVPDEFTVELIRAVREAGGTPLVEVRHTRVSRELLREMNQEQAALVRDVEMFRMKKMQAYIAIRGSANASENADVPSELMQLYSKIIRPVQDYRVNKTRWCVLRWPTPSMAQAASMSTEAFENLYFDVCTMDYAKMARAMVPLEKLMKRADKVHLRSPGTDLTFSIKGIGAKMCKGDRNIPTVKCFLPGERFCERRDSIQHADALFGTKFENVRLELVDGKIVNATANNTKRLNEILDTDAGARYIGEFSLGFNPHILSPMCDILFDEKIAGSLHFTPVRLTRIAATATRARSIGHGFDPAQGLGGGEVWFDGELIRKDGFFCRRI